MKETDSAEKSEKVTCAARPTREQPWPCQRLLEEKELLAAKLPKTMDLLWIISSQAMGRPSAAANCCC